MKKIKKFLLILVASILLSGCGLLSNIVDTTITNEEITTSIVSTTEDETTTTKDRTTTIESTTTEGITIREENTTTIESTTGENKTTKEEVTTTEKQTTSTNPTTSTTTSQEKTTTTSSTTTQNQGSENVLTFDDKSYVNNEKSSYSYDFSGYTFEFSNVSEYDDGFINLNKNGIITNSTGFYDIDSIYVEYTTKQVSGDEKQYELGFGSLYYTTDNYYISNPSSYERLEVTNSSTITFDDDPNFIAFYTFNSILIEKIVINYTSGTYVKNSKDFTINLVATNDIHGQVNADDSHAGLEEVSYYIENSKKNNKYNIYLDQGDIYQGSAASYYSGGYIMDDFLAINGCDSRIIGNHEWDWGESYIETHQDYSESDILAANVRYTDGSTPSWVKPYSIIERCGIKIGVIGVIGDCLSSISSSKVENIEFIVDSSNNKALSNLIVDYAVELNNLGCSFIILQIHEGSAYTYKGTENVDIGYSSIDMSILKDYIGLVLESHTHYAYYHKDTYGIYHVQCGGYLNSIATLKLKVTNTLSTPKITVEEPSLIYYSSLSKKSTLMGDVNEWYKDNMYGSISTSTYGDITAKISETEINELCARAYYELIDKYDLNSKLSSGSISFGGGYIQCRSPKCLGDTSTSISNPYTVSYSDISNLFPFDNDMYVVKWKGSYVRSTFFNNKNYYYAYSEDLTYNSITTSKYYYFVTDSYTYDYYTSKSNPMEIVYNITDDYGIYPRDVFGMYLKSLYSSNEDDDEQGQTGDVTTTSFVFNYDYTKILKGSTTLTESLNGTDVLTITTTNIIDKSSYSEFGLAKTSSQILIELPEGYEFVYANVKQYSTYINLEFLSDDSGNTIDTMYGTTYELESTSDGYLFTFNDLKNNFLISNTSNYNVSLYYIEVKVQTK